VTSAAGKTEKWHYSDMIVSSPAERAAHTARKVAHKLDFPENRIVYDREVYSADNTICCGFFSMLMIHAKS
jgi:phosphohistidine phosphatase SixA